MTGREDVQKALGGLQVPLRHDSAWIGPFEQLVGAGYALLAAEQQGILERDLELYHLRVQRRITSLILEHFTRGSLQDRGTFKDWTSGFYFNCAIQRSVWAAERLLLTFAAIECACGKRGAEGSVATDIPKFPSILKATDARLEHVLMDDGKDLLKTKAVRGQFPSEYHRIDPLNRGAILAMLRYDVNNRKHRIYGRTKLRDRESAKKGDNKTWSTSGAELQMELACEAFVLVCECLNELMEWNPSA